MLDAKRPRGEPGRRGDQGLEYETFRSARLTLVFLSTLPQGIEWQRLRTCSIEPKACIASAMTDGLGYKQTRFIRCQQWRECDVKTSLVQIMMNMLHGAGYFANISNARAFQHALSISPKKFRISAATMANSLLFSVH